MSLFKARHGTGALEGSYFAPFFVPVPNPAAPGIERAAFTAAPKAGVPVGVTLTLFGGPEQTLSFEWRVSGATVAETATYTPEDGGALLEVRVTAKNPLGSVSFVVGPAVIAAGGQAGFPYTLPFEMVA